MTASPANRAPQRPWAVTGRALRWIGATSIAAIALTRCLIVFAPQLYFDVDPAFDPTPLAGFGPAGSLTLDVLLLLGSALALAGEAIGRRGVDPRLLVLALLPLPVILFHGWNDLGDLWRGMTWQAAAVAAVAAAHLARESSLRIVMVALLLAAIAPLLIRGGAQMTFEHAETVQAFEQSREAFFRDRGWSPDSPAVVVYERRLRQPQPLGWFATTNIYASLMTAAAILLAGLAAGLWRAKLPKRWPMLAGALAILCGVAVVASGSKGAIGTMLLVLVIALAPLLIPRLRGPLRKVGLLLLIALPALGLLAVVVRGWLLPESFAGDRSLLFRWHYLSSAFRVFTDSAANALVGVGPDGFQDAYVEHRVPRNPEEVASSHSMFIDWLTMLGFLGVAWIALVLLQLARAGHSLREQVEYVSGEAIEEVMQRLARVAVVVLIVALIPPIVIELHTLGTLHLALRIAGAVGFAMLMLLIGYLALHLERPHLGWPLAAAATALILHGQIEMTFFQPGFVVWGWCALGLAAPATVRSSASARPGAFIAAGVALLAALILIFGVVPAAQQQALMRNATAALYPPAGSPARQVAQREQAAILLERAASISPAFMPLRLHTARQYERAAQLSEATARVKYFRKALHALDSEGELAPLGIIGARASIVAQLALATGKDSWFDEAIAAAETLTQRDPHSPMSWVRLGELLWLAQRRDEAAAAYRVALEKNGNFALDPSKQLAEAQRSLIEDRIAAADTNEP